MAIKMCENGHFFDKASCTVCPICSKDEMTEKYGADFPNIGAPAFRALDGAGIHSLTDLTKYSEDDLLALHGFGPRALRILSEALAAQGLSIAKKSE